MSDLSICIYYMKMWFIVAVSHITYDGKADISRLALILNHLSVIIILILLILSIFPFQFLFRMCIKMRRLACVRNSVLAYGAC